MPIWELPQPLSDRIPEKIVGDLPELVRRVDALKRAGRVVVFTNGAFDLLHAGHVRSLRHARALGDHLVVAVNSDASVRRAKGAHRPFFPESERLELVAALEPVDTVFLFDDDTADRLLEALKPQIHAKGPDYAVDTVPERATVAAYRGRVVIVGDRKDHSSSSIHRRLCDLRPAPGAGGGGDA
ncbi:MAG: adenylyltransferase/cytidyltransferase family protein [Planctomycetota bacterium]